MPDTRFYPEEPQGLTPSEKVVARLCNYTFLSLWSYPNVFTDEGRKGGKGPGKELCDLFVVFGDHVLIFSVKSIGFNQNIPLETAWPRWFKKAVMKSASQIYGAESWIKRFPNRLFLDRKCERALPLPIPDPGKANYHRIAVALGSYDACQTHFGKSSSGSLFINSRLIGESHYEKPFSIGVIDHKKGFIHVFDELSLITVMRELDTVSDFTAYLSRKEALFTDPKISVIAPGEEQLLACYLSNVNSKGQHHFNVPDTYHGYVYVSEGFWDAFYNSPEYVENKLADKPSYFWDFVIEHLIDKCLDRCPITNIETPLAYRELGLRLLASEPRIRRSQLAEALHDVLDNAPDNMIFARRVISERYPDIVYVFLIMPILDDFTLAENRNIRRIRLVHYCKVAKLTAKNASYVVGIATEPSSSKLRSEDLCALNLKDWTKEMQEEAESLQKEFSLFLPDNVSTWSYNKPESLKLRKT